MAWRRRIVRTVFRISVLALLSVPRIASASEVHGQVTFGGLPVPGATVTATLGDKKFTTVSDERGVYTFADLPDGTWNFKIEMQMFSPVEAQVAVAPNAPAGKWELTLLPLDQMMARSKVLQPRITVAPAVIAAAREKKADDANVEMPRPPDDSQKPSDGFLVNGSSSNAATSKYSLAAGFGNGRPSTKSLYTGGLGFIYDSSALDARPYSITGLSSPKPSYNTMTGLASIGGPIRIPRLLPRGPNFFVSYQWTRSPKSLINQGLVPTLAERAGDLSGVVNALGQPLPIYNPFTGQPFAGNIVPVNAQAQALLNLYPLPNLAGDTRYNYQAPVLNSSHQDALESRLDKGFGRKDQVYGGFSFQSVRSGNTSLFGFTDTTDTLGLNGNINWTHRFSQRLFLFTGYRLSRLRTQVATNFENRQNISAAAGITGNDQDPADWGPPTLNFSSGITSLTDAQSSFNRNRTDAFNGSVATYHGRHNVTIGGDLRKQEYNDFFQQNPRGAFNFTGAATQATSTLTTSGSDLADFLLGVPDTSQIAYGNADKYLRQPVYDAYLTDDWRLMPILTLNIGVRWEYGAPITELKGRLVNLDVANGFSAVAPVLASDPIGSLTGSHYPASLIRPDRTGVEPRVGLSWRPIPASTVVVRAGYGIYQDTSVYQNTALLMAQQAPLSKSLSVENSAACPQTLASGFNQCATTTAQTFGVDPNFHVGYAQTWQLAVQRDLPFALQGTATYLGVKGTHGVQQFLPNTYPVGAANPCPSCPLGFVYEATGGNSTRESLQLQLRRRLRSGLAASLLYTYSKSVDDDASLGGQGPVATGSQSTAQITTQSYGAIAQNWRNLAAERSRSSFDQRHLLNAQLQYTTGMGAGGGTLMEGWHGRLLKEWTVLTTIVAGSGLPETPLYEAAIPGTAFTNILRPNPTGVSVYRAQTGLHLDPAAYVAPITGQFGTAGRNSITGPSQFTLNASLQRTFRPSKRFFLDGRLDATNLLNKAVFTGWNTIINSTQFGTPASANPMRSIQTTLRLRF
jgi:hypothetical protein